MQAVLFNNRNFIRAFTGTSLLIGYSLTIGSIWNSRQWKCYCDGIKTEEELWMEKKKDCSLCRAYFASPCRQQFIQFVRCCEGKAPEKIEECGAFYEKLAECETENNLETIQETQDSEKS